MRASPFQFRSDTAIMRCGVGGKGVDSNSSGKAFQRGKVGLRPGTLQCTEYEFARGHNSEVPWMEAADPFTHRRRTLSRYIDADISIEEITHQRVARFR